MRQSRRTRSTYELPLGPREPCVPVTPSAYLSAYLPAPQTHSSCVWVLTVIRCRPVSQQPSLGSVFASLSLLKEAPRGQEQIPALSNEFALGTQRAEIVGRNERHFCTMSPQSDLPVFKVYRAPRSTLVGLGPRSRVHIKVHGAGAQVASLWFESHHAMVLPSL